MEKRVIEQIHRQEIYTLPNDIEYIMEYIDGVEQKRYLKHVNPKACNGKRLSAQYRGKDFSTCIKKYNPFVYNHKWYGELPNVDQIDMDQIVLVHNDDHSIYDINLNPIPIIQHLDYIQAGLHNNKYDLEKVYKKLQNHPNVVSCSKILDIPFYNSEKYQDKYLQVEVIPDVKVYKQKEQLKKLRGPDEYICIVKLIIDWLDLKEFEIVPREDDDEYGDRW